jgi:hypothetical protein
MLALMLFAFLNASHDAADLPVEDRCDIVGAVLGHNEENARGALSKMSCVLNNDYANGKVVVEVNLVGPNDGKEPRRTTFLKKGDTCGGYLVPIVLKDIRKRLHGIIGAVVVNLRILDVDQIEFNAYLRNYDPKDPDERKGSIGTGCGAAVSGLLEKRKGKWVYIGGRANLKGLEYR